jgi:hypothetical protein
MDSNSMRGFHAILSAAGMPITNFLEIGSRDGHDAHEFASVSGIDQVCIAEPSPKSFREIVAAYPRYRVFRTALSNYEGRGASSTSSRAITSSAE